MTVNLTGVGNVQKITVALTNVTDSSANVVPNTASEREHADRRYDREQNGYCLRRRADQGATRFAITAANFRTDVNADAGQITLQTLLR